MITIIPNTVNQVALTLTELQTLPACDWLFVFTNDMTGEEKIFSATDISTATARYNLFNITENTVEDPLNATISLTPVGYWSYKVYEMNISSPADLNPLNAVTTVEVGKVFVVGPNRVIKAFDYDDVKNNKAFDY